MSNGISAHIWCNGNQETGTPGTETNVNTCLIAFTDSNHRKAVRKQLEQCFSHIWQQPAKVLFSDEINAK